jgi:uncharacterized protein (DUF1330 family)
MDKKRFLVLYTYEQITAGSNPRKHKTGDETMTAFFVATVTIKDPAKFQEYSKKAGETFAAHQGELVIRGKLEKALSGKAKNHAVGIVKFPDHDALNAWYNSAAYQAIIPLRDEAAAVTITAYSVPE